MLVKFLVALLYLGILIFFAIRARRRTQSIEDYYVGGRSLPTLLVVLSFYATFVSTNSFVGHSAKSFVFGVSWLIVGAILTLLTLLSWLVIAPRFREKVGQLGSVVPSDMFRLHFDSVPAGAVAAGIILFDSIFFLAAVFLGASESMGVLLGIPFGVALLIVFCFQIMYTAIGGYLADVWSDSLQSVILLVGVIALPLAVVSHAGGWGPMWESLARVDSARLSSGEDVYSLIRITTAAPLLMIVGIGLSGGLKFVADPRQLSRFYGLRDAASARRGVWMITALVGGTYLLLLPIGLFARALDLPPEVAARTDAIVPWLLGEAQIVGLFLGTVILMALLAAAMSSIDSVLLIAAAALQTDILPRFARYKGSTSVAGARRLVFIYALLPAGLAALSRLYPSANLGIVELTVFSGALFAAAFLPPLLGILYWRRASAAGAITGMVFGVGSTAVWKFVVVPINPELGAFPEVFLGVGVGTLAFVAGSLYGPRGEARVTPGA